MRPICMAEKNGNSFSGNWHELFIRWLATVFKWRCSGHDERYNALHPLHRSLPEERASDVDWPIWRGGDWQLNWFLITFMVSSSIQTSSGSGTIPTLSGSTWPSHAQEEGMTGGLSNPGIAQTDRPHTISSGKWLDDSDVVQFHRIFFANIAWW